MLKRHAKIAILSKMSRRPPLERAILDGDVEKVKERLAAGNKAEREPYESNMLHVAVSHGTPEIVEIILSTGIDVNSLLSRRLLYTPLHIAAVHNRPEMVELLLAHGAVIDAEAKEGITPFLLAIEKGSLAVADALAKNGANIYKRAAAGDAHRYAAGNSDTIKYLENLYEMQRWKGVAPSSTQQVYMLAAGHGGETLGERNYKIPPGTTLVTMTRCGVPSYNNEIYEKLIDMFIPAEDEDEETTNGRKEILLDITSNLFEIEEALELPHGTFRVFTEGKPCPNLSYQPVAFVESDTFQEMYKSGVYSYPLPATGFFDSAGERVVYESSKGVKVDDDLLSTIYKDSIYPTQTTAKRVFAATDYNLFRAASVLSAHIYEIMTHLGPGVYFYFVCRTPSKRDFPAYSALEKMGNKYKYIINDPTLADTQTEIPLLPKNVEAIGRMKLLRAESQELQNVVRKPINSRRRRGGGRRKTRRRKQRPQCGGTAFEVAYAQILGGNNTSPTKLDAEIMRPEPEIKIMNTEPAVLYTVLMYDPDAVGSTPGTKANYLHYLKVNSNMNCVPYKGPSPPPGSGVHHYTFILYKQLRPLSCAAQPRSPFDLEGFVRANGLTEIQKTVFEVSSP